MTQCISYKKDDIYGICYDGITHYFVQNVQGDIIGLLNKTGTLVAKYEYDAWGNVTAIPVAEDSCGHSVDSPDHIAHVNPFRYRGYYYDAETEFYYIYSRYYDPEVSRYVNADYVYLLGANGDFASLKLFAYCGNNPGTREDSNGGFWVTAGLIAVGGLIGASISEVSSALTQQALTGTVNWKSVKVQRR